MSRILIAGCGYIGSECARILAETGAEVVATRRTPRVGEERYATHALDLGDLLACERFFLDMPDFDALLVTIAASRGDEAGYRAAYVDALENLCAAAAGAHANPPLLLFTSSTSVYAQDAGEWVDEQSATEPAGFRGRIQLEAEAIVARWPGAHAVLRLGGIYGPGRSTLARRVRDGDLTANEADPYTNRIHRDDAAGALAHLVQKHLDGSALPPTLLGVDNAPVARSEILEWLKRGFKTPSEAPPQAPAKAGARSEPQASEVHQGRPQASEVHEGRAQTGKRCRNGKLRESGYRFSYPTYREGYAAVLQSDREFADFTPP